MMATATKTLLLINGDRNQREVLQEYLSYFGNWDVSTTPYPLAALASAAEHQPDVILFDLSTCGMTFFSFLKHLRSQPETQNVPVILMAAGIQWFNADIIKDLEIAGVINYDRLLIDLPQQIATLLNWDC